MESVRNQRSIASPVTVTGFGYWSGRDVRVEFRPAAVGTGIVFVRDDVDPSVTIPASIEFRLASPLRTILSTLGVRVEMVEHVMAARAGLQVDNCEVHVDVPEMPGVDGSALPFVEALDQVGMVEQSAPRPLQVIRDAVRVGGDEGWIEALPASGDRLTVRYELDYGSGTAIGCQTIELEITPESFRDQLAPSRTFIRKEEAESLRAQGLGARVTTQDLLIFGPDGPIDNPLRFADECVRHKTLDVIGDFALAGCDFQGTIVAHRSGHRLNAELAAALVGKVMPGSLLIAERS